MSQDDSKIAVLGLTRAEALDLRNHLAKYGGAVLEETPTDQKSAGVLDPISIVVISLGSLAIQGLTAWLAKDRHESEIEQEVEVRRKDGSHIRKVLRVRRKDAISGEHIESILRSLDTDVS